MANALECWRFRLALPRHGSDEHGPVIGLSDGGRWSVMIRHAGGLNQLGFFLQAEEPVEPREGNRAVRFQFFLINQEDEQPDGVGLQTQSRPLLVHDFREAGETWGYAEFCRLTTEFYRSSDATVVVQVEIAPAGKGGKEPTADVGYVGLRNQGATCYLNSLLQSHFCMPPLREAVYQLPSNAATAEVSVPLALQRLFFRMQTSVQSVSTTELTKSFGWESLDAFTQHDVMELNSVLRESLEQKMKGTDVEGRLAELFEGKLRQYVRCVDVDFESTREDKFTELMLIVKKMGDLRKSLGAYLAEEMLDDYKADGVDEPQKAKKGVAIEELPPFLNMQLMRFEYDPMRDGSVKINDRFAFPDEVDLGEFVTPPPPEDDDAGGDERKPRDSTYRLHSVLVHSGEVNSGHYFAYIRPTAEDQWYRFDDETVRVASASEAMDENFGYNPEPLPEDALSSCQVQHSVLRRCTSAYMLVYVRKAELSSLLAPASVEKIPKALWQRLERERLEEERRAEEALHARVVAVVGEHKGTAQYQRVLRVRKDQTLAQVAAEAVREVDFHAAVTAGETGDDRAAASADSTAVAVPSIWRLGPRPAAFGAWRPEQRLDPSTLVSQGFARELTSGGALHGGKTASARVARTALEGPPLCAIFVDTETDPEPELSEDADSELKDSALIIFKKVTDGGRVLAEIGRVTCSVGTTVSDCEVTYRLLSDDDECEQEVLLYEEIAPGSLTECADGDAIVANGAILVGIPVDADELDTAAVTGWTLWSRELFEKQRDELGESRPTVTSDGGFDRHDDEQHGTIAQWFALQDSLSVNCAEFDGNFRKYKPSSQEQPPTARGADDGVDTSTADGSDKATSSSFQLRLSKGDTYDDVAQIVASRLGVEKPMSLHFYAARVEGEAPVRCSRLREDGALLKLEDMLRVHHRSATTLLYCVGQYSITELEGSEGLAHFTLTLPSGQPAQPEPLQLLVNAADTVGSIVRRLASGPLPAGFLRSAKGERAQRLRLVSTQHGRVRRLYSVDDTLDVADLQSWGGIATTTLRIQEIPPPELRLRASGELLPGVGWKLVYCYHCELSKPVARLFGEPLLLTVQPDDSLASVKQRLKAVLGVGDEEFSRWNLHVLQHSQSSASLQDGADLMALLDHQADGSSLAQGDGPKTLGIEHVAAGTGEGEGDSGGGGSNKRPRIFKAGGGVKIWG